jgi:hypothetical protein
VLHASWNGATTVRRWEVLARDGVSLRRVATAADHGFETTITLRSPADTFVVRAISARGRVLGQSDPVDAAPA